MKHQVHSKKISENQNWIMVFSVETQLLSVLGYIHFEFALIHVLFESNKNKH